MGNLAPRTGPFEQLRPVGAHTDAQGYGLVAAVSYGGSRNLTHFHLPEWFCAMAEPAEGESPIFLYELCAAILMVYIANEWADTTPRTCVLRVDNQAAATALIKGSSPSSIAGALVSLFWNVAARGNTRWWIEYLNAKSNSADYPSRQCDKPTETICGTARGRSPAEFRDAFTSRGNLSREATVFRVYNKN